MENRTIRGTETGDTGKSVSILLIGFDSTQIGPLSRGLHERGYKTVPISDPIGALEHIYGTKGAAPNTIIIDLNTMRRSGMEVIRIIRAYRPGFPIIAYAASDADSWMEDIEIIGIPIIHKPIDMVQLDKDIQALLYLAEAVKKERTWQ